MVNYIDTNFQFIDFPGGAQQTLTISRLPLQNC